MDYTGYLGVFGFFLFGWIHLEGPSEFFLSGTLSVPKVEFQKNILRFERICVSFFGSGNSVASYAGVYTVMCLPFMHKVYKFPR